MKQWSGWAHTLRTKESRRKPDKNTVKIIEKEDVDGVKSNEVNGEDIGGGVGDGKKVNMLTQDSKRMKKEETRAINVKKIEAVDEVKKKVDEVDVEEVGDIFKLEGRDENEDQEVEENEDGEGKEAEQEQDEHAPPKDQHNTNRPTDITYAQMAETGKKVKRILDHGRVKFLKHLGLRAAQLKYCHPSLSPECIMIVADRQ
jgi:Methyltransferase TRM13